MCSHGMPALTSADVADLFFSSQVRLLRRLANDTGRNQSSLSAATCDSTFSKEDGRMASLCKVVRNISRVAAIPFVAAIALAAYVVIASAQAPQGGNPPEKITFLLDFTAYGKHAPFFVARDKGFWKDAGFDVTIVPGAGSATTVSSYASGAVDFAFADVPTLILARAKGAHIKVAGIIHDKSLYAIGTLEENNIKTPQDLAGKRIGSSIGDASRVLFPAFAQINHIDPASVHWVDMTPPARAGSLIVGQVDAVALFLTEVPTFSAVATEAGKHWKDFSYADYGLDLYSHGILVRDELIANNPDRVRRFIGATMRAWAWSIEHPQEALAIFDKDNPAVNPDQAKEHFRIAVDHIMTDTAKREGIGYIDPKKMEHTVEVVSKYFNVKGVSADDVYTNQFTPKLFPKEVPF
ncbi:MAG TPA: ABC transporter substrate-binding protein [Xanthobacteraceae bacterium]|jgi:NitT/TauT family transport system substrate-binding protein